MKPRKEEKGATPFRPFLYALYLCKVCRRIVPAPHYHHSCCSFPSRELRAVLVLALYYRGPTRVTHISHPPLTPARPRCCWTGSRLKSGSCVVCDASATVRPWPRTWDLRNAAPAAAAMHARPPSEVAQRLPFSVANAAAVIVTRSLVALACLAPGQRAAAVPSFFLIQYRCTPLTSLLALPSARRISPDALHTTAAKFP